MVMLPGPCRTRRQICLRDTTMPKILIAPALYGPSINQDLLKIPKLAHTAVHMTINVQVSRYTQRSESAPQLYTQHDGFPWLLQGMRPNGTRTYVLWVPKSQGKSLHWIIAQTYYASNARRFCLFSPESKSASASAQIDLLDAPPRRTPFGRTRRGRAGQAMPVWRVDHRLVGWTQLVPSLSYYSEAWSFCDSHRSALPIHWNMVSKYSYTSRRARPSKLTTSAIGLSCKLRLVVRLRGLGMAVLGPGGKRERRIHTRVCERQRRL